MPVNESNWGGGQPRRHSFKLNGVRDELVQDARLANSVLYRDHTCADGPAAVQHTQGATHNGIKPKSKVNGYASHGFWSTRTKTTSVYKKEDQKPICNSKAKEPESTGSVIVNGANSLEKQPVSTAVCDQNPAELGLQITSKSQRKKKKPWHRRYKVASPENIVLQAPEDWEEEIQEVKVNNWEKMTFGIQPYGQVDVVNFTLRDLSLERTTSPLWQVTSNLYLPAVHHRCPVDWLRYKPPPEPGQFSDAED